MSVSASLTASPGVFLPSCLGRRDKRSWTALFDPLVEVLARGDLVEQSQRAVVFSLSRRGESGLVGGQGGLLLAEADLRQHFLGLGLDAETAGFGFVGQVAGLAVIAPSVKRASFLKQSLPLVRRRLSRLGLRGRDAFDGRGLFHRGRRLSRFVSRLNRRLSRFERRSNRSRLFRSRRSRGRRLSRFERRSNRSRPFRRLFGGDRQLSRLIRRTLSGLLDRLIRRTLSGLRYGSVLSAVDSDLLGSVVRRRVLVLIAVSSEFDVGIVDGGTSDARAIARSLSTASARSALSGTATFIANAWSAFLWARSYLPAAIASLASRTRIEYTSGRAWAFEPAVRSASRSRKARVASKIFLGLSSHIP